ncbi:MFS transporter permease [Stutzerimonas azotifigens]|uniref:MFS transporter permease n=1 Tax=Stutzerimonas azotifigens TaxID=291995 RepID=A0ABR5Z1X5_9GAMM|nr:MFS transporter permease [Stutzerimonas azotifigens]MBA1274220.1 MFS transporter permease [Stutzerimonas azotifigens]
MENIYQAPASELVEPTTHNAFFVTSIRKLVVLYFATFGLYAWYWVYKQWQAYRANTGERVWPVARALFQIFFMHSLGRAISRRLEVEGLGRWDYGANATAYVVLVIASTALNFVVGGEAPGMLNLLTILVSLACMLPLTAFQKMANQACGDSLGQGNAKFSWANVLWILLGVIFWALTIAGFLLG